MLKLPSGMQKPLRRPAFDIASAKLVAIQASQIIMTMPCQPIQHSDKPALPNRSSFLKKVFVRPRASDMFLWRDNKRKWRAILMKNRRPRELDKDSWDARWL